MFLPLVYFSKIFEETHCKSLNNVRMFSYTAEFLLTLTGVLAGTLASLAQKYMKRQKTRQ